MFDIRITDPQGNVYNYFDQSQSEVDAFENALDITWTMVKWPTEVDGCLACTDSERYDDHMCSR